MAELTSQIICHMNAVNLSFQGPAITIMAVTERLQAFQARLPSWKKSSLKTDNFANFPTLSNLPRSNQ